MPTLLPAQLYDYQWIMGSGPNNPEDIEGGTIMDFHANPVSLIYRPMLSGGRTEAFTNICNAEGVLQFYTNNCSIINSQEMLIQNGNGLNAPGSEWALGRRGSTKWCCLAGGPDRWCGSVLWCCGR